MERSPPLRLIFMGTPDFAVPALHALRAAGHEIKTVYCQPPKPAGRGHEIQKTPIHRAAEEMGLEVRTPKTLRDEAEQSHIKSLAPDAIIVAAYGLILPQAVLDIPRLGCFNIHGSLLPRWRGAAPIHRSLLAGDSETGITIMRMEAGLDTGPMLLKDSIPITSASTASSLHDALAEMGARLIVQALDLAAQGRLPETKQPEEGVTYAAKLTREDGAIDWTLPAAEIERQVRALNPWPGAFFKLGEETIKVLKAEPAPQNAASPPASLLDEDFTVACGAGALRLTLVQRAGKKPIDGASFLRGARLAKGERLA